MAAMVVSDLRILGQVGTTIGLACCSTRWSRGRS
jgi:uncharacterized membrane protein YdfJ with MMPL/SSD domain